MTPIRPFKILLALMLTVATMNAFAFSLAQLSNRDAVGGMKAALEQGAVAAVAKLGATDGFLGNQEVRIPLPGLLEQARPILKITGQAQQLDSLVVSMNRAAEAAIPLAKPLLIEAVRSMSFSDAKGILAGGETSVTDFFRARTTGPLTAKFLPIVKGVTDQSGLATRYNATMAQAAKFSLVADEQAKVESYVTQRALDGLFHMIGEEEKAIRRDPFGSGSRIIGKVFGALK